jgi:hypothetical protein
MRFDSSFMVKTFQPTTGNPSFMSLDAHGMNGPAKARNAEESN